MEAAVKGDDNPEECPVCLTDFDDTVQRPRCLPCGHTVCTSCIDKLKEQGHVACLQCCVSHAVPEGGEFPVNYIAEEFIRVMWDANVAAAASLPPSARKRKGEARAAGKKKVARLSKKMCSFLEEQEATVMDAIAACREVESQLDLYKTTLTGWGEQQRQLEDRLQGLVDQSKSAREIVELEKSHVAAKDGEVKNGRQELQAVLETLYAPAIDQEAGMAVAETVRCLGKVEQVVEECQESFPDASAVTTVRKVRVASSVALEAVQTVQMALETVTKEDLQSQSDPEEARPQSTQEEARPQSTQEEARPQSDPAKSSAQSELESTIMGRLQFILMLSLKAEDLRSLTQPARSLLQAGLVFAVHQVEGQRRHARISLEAGRLYLYALKEQPLPLGASTLQVSEVVPPSPPCTVFLDLSWPGRATRRVKIHLSPDTPWGRQFLLLCSGQRGPSYRNTNLLWVVRKGRLGESVIAGDYESNDGKGTSRLLSDLDKGEYRRSGRLGDVCGLRWSGHNRCARGLFGIFTKNRQENDMSGLVFGEVVEGLPVVVEAAKYSNIRKVTVVDCGVVL
ncbi:uncharacterized protein LOC127005592 isoform X3 [Eriocheir sinensis]|uniref:uncharacterized protein LOC127005592 isoform X3 n=1 Tax=Eriocheir sinensis TaxID=95602 RepID=UPI0021C8796D|nr:uncharacterized protein LOC127005592 isoform X3 [Eriocheir sinensis]